MSTQLSYTNPWGWSTPITDKVIGEFPYAPLEQPAENVALRLVVLAHVGFNTRVWGPGSGRMEHYWQAFAERVVAATNNPTVVTWWCTLIQSLDAEPLTLDGYLHEKNMLVRPQALTPPVADSAVLNVLRSQHLDMVDRTRYWVRARRDRRTES